MIKIKKIVILLSCIVAGILLLISALTILLMPDHRDGEMLSLQPTVGGASSSREPVRAGKNVNIYMWVNTDYLMNEINIQFVLPPEIIVQHGPTSWTGSIDDGTYNKTIFTLRFVSKTDAEQWSHPVEIHMSFKAESAGDSFIQAGYYSKVIKWSHEGFKDPGWTISKLSNDPG